MFCEWEALGEDENAPGRVLFIVDGLELRFEASEVRMLPSWS